MYFLPYNKNLKEFSRKLRKNSTYAEVLLWNELKQRKISGFQFNRQKTADATEGVTYAWSTGEISESIEVNADGVYSVTVTTPEGCIATGNETISGFDASALLSSYTILASKEAELKKNNYVLSGAVGVSGAGEKVKIKDDSQVAWFTKADQLDIDGSSSTGSYIAGQANVALPPFKFNPYNSNNDVKVDDNTSMVLTDSIYDKVELKKNAKVTFTQPRVYLKELKTKEHDTILVAPCSELIIEKKFELKKHTIFNPTGEQVTVYVDDKAKVDEGSDVTATIYATKDIDVKGKDDAPTFMTGMFIGEKVKGDDYVTWNWNRDCLCPAPTLATAAKRANVENDVLEPGEDGNIFMTAYPNPFKESVTIEFQLERSERVVIDIISINGENIERLFDGTVEKDELNRASFQSGSLAGGIYFYRLITEGGEVYNRKLMLVR